MSEIKTRCLFIVEEVNRKTYGEEIKLNVVFSTDDSTEEEKRFTMATPSGSMEFFVENPYVIGTINPGEKYYVSLTPFDEGD